MNFQLAKSLCEIFSEAEFVENHQDYGIIIKEYELGYLLTSIIKNADKLTVWDNWETYALFENICDLTVKRSGDDYLIY